MLTYTVRLNAAGIMTPLERWTKQIQDAIAENSALREGLQDDEALPLIDWGAQQAEQLGARMSAPDAPEPDEEQVANTAYSLVRLMTRVTWLAVYRHKKDATWLTRTFQTINQLSRELYGPQAPVFSDEAIAAWIAGHAQHSNGDLVRGLTAYLSPPQPGGEGERPTPAPAQPASLPEWKAGPPAEPPTPPGSVPGRETHPPIDPFARPALPPGREAEPPAGPAPQRGDIP